MTAPFATAGLWMLLTLAALIIGTGLPVWALLIGTASLFATGGWIMGAIDASVLAAISGRTLGLLEHDLLQALPLYVFVGVLLQRLSVADALFAALARLFRWTGAGTSVAAFGVDAGKSVVVRGGGRRGAARGDAGPATSTSATSVPATTPDCDPPYSVDAMGRKRFKLECVGK